MKRLLILLAFIAMMNTATANINVSVNIWEEVESEVFAMANNTIIIQTNYDVEMTDPYINDLGYIIFINLDKNRTDLYEDCNMPFASAENALDFLNLGNWMGSNTTEPLTNATRSLFMCDRYWFRGQYLNGMGNVTMNWTGNYSLYFISGTMTFENNVSPPHLVHGGLTIPFGKITFIDDSQTYMVDLYVTHDTINWWDGFSNTLFFFMAIVLPIPIFFILAMIGVGIRASMAIALFFPVLVVFLKILM